MMFFFLFMTEERNGIPIGPTVCIW